MSVSSKIAGATGSRWAPWLAAAILALSLIVAGVADLLDRIPTLADVQDNALILASKRLLSAMKDVETGERGFIITGGDQYLEP